MWLAILLSIGVGIVMGSSIVTIRAQEPAAKTEAPAAAPTRRRGTGRGARGGGPRSARARSDQARPRAPIRPGAGYTGASIDRGVDRRTNGKVTPETLAKDVKLLKIGINMFWTLMTGFLVMFMQAGFALVETGLDARQERRRTRWR